MTIHRLSIEVPLDVAMKDIDNADVAARVAAWRAEGWEGNAADFWLIHLHAIARALYADKVRLTNYLIYRWAWDVIADDPAITLCQDLGAPGESEEMVKYLLGLHLPPATRRYLQDALGSDMAFEFLENLEEIIAVRPVCADCGAVR